MKDAPIFGLVCAGGGAHGAYQVGVLKYIHEKFCVGDASPFRVFGGTSAGSLNTSFLASRSFDARLASPQLEQMWRDFHVKEYHGNIVKNALYELSEMLPRLHRQRKHSWSLLSPEPLREVADKGFVRADFEKALREGTTLGLAVSATEVRSARCVWFQEGPGAAPWNTVRATGLLSAISATHIQASCSVPFAFPPVEIDGLHFADGGVANVGPLTPAVNMGATRILSVATDMPIPQALPEADPTYKPHIGDIIEMLLTQLSNDFTEQQALIFRFFNGLVNQANAIESADQTAARHVLVGNELHPSDYQPVETLAIAPSRRIRHTSLFNPELFDESLGKKSTVMLFHRDFLGDLIAFGYDDARGRHDELDAFFRAR